MLVSWAYGLHSFDLFGLEVIEVCGISGFCLCLQPVVYVLCIWSGLFVVRRVLVLVILECSEVLLQFDRILPFLEGGNGIDFIDRHNGVRSRFIDPLLNKFIVLPYT